jgi:hypothetical protein
LKKRIDTYLSGQDKWNMGKKSASWIMWKQEKKHVADLLVSEKDIDYGVMAFWSRIDAHRRQQHAQKWGGRRESVSTSTKLFQAAGDEEEKDKRSVYTLLGDVELRLRQWEGVGRRRGGEGGCGRVQVQT